MLTILIERMFGIRMRYVHVPYLNGIAPSNSVDIVSYALGSFPPNYPVPAPRVSSGLLFLDTESPPVFVTTVHQPDKGHGYWRMIGVKL